jgi:hypothetical protein
MRKVKMKPSSVHSFADRTSSRGDQVTHTASQAGGGSLHGQSLGSLGSAAASRQQQLVGHTQDTLTKTGSRLQQHADRLHDNANATTQVDNEAADRFHSINLDKSPPSNVRPSTSSPSRPSGQSGKPGATSLDDFRGPDGKIHVDQMSAEEYDKFAPHWQNLMKTEPDKAWFWSGGHVQDAKFDDNGSRVDPATGKTTTDPKYLGPILGGASDSAHANGGNTLEGLMDDHKITMPGFKDNNPNAERMWKDASMTLAHQSSGVVHVALPNTTGTTSGWANNGDTIASRRPDNVFDMDEFPILRHNPNVTQIVAHDAQYGTQDVIWDRASDPQYGGGK